MPRIARVLALMGSALCAAPMLDSFATATPERNVVLREPVSIGPEAGRLLIGFKVQSGGAVSSTTIRRRAREYTITQAQTTPADARALAQRTGVAIARTGQITPSMHVLYLPKTLYGADVLNALAALRADPQVAFAAVDGKRYPQQITPNDPLFAPTPLANPPANGQWYFNNPATSSITYGGTVYQDYSAIDAVDAWTTTTGSAGIVIADVDTGVRFDHPDLLRAGLGSGGRLLPGYDFVGQDYNPNPPYDALGTYLEANDGDGWDPDPSDPGDWISSSDTLNSLFADCMVGNSSWHGTRVVGIFGAITDNSTGIAGLTWATPTQAGPWVLPVRSLGKCGGYDSNIIAGIEWAAGMSVTDPDTGVAVPKNPYPADIINLSIGGGTDACSSSGNGAAYHSALPEVTQLGVLIVIAAGNANGAVELPADCATVIPGVMAVAGVRNVGTKVGYSSFGAQVSVAAPAGNCIETSGDCLRSIDSTTNLGTTTPIAGASGASYTNEVSENLGTSFATPIVAGIAALVRSVNDNLTPAQLAARLESSASAFPPAGTEPVCPSVDANQECACPASGQCGSGLANAYQAVIAAQRPIAAVAITGGGSVQLSAAGSAAACGRSIKSYAWTAGSGVTIVSGAGTSKVTVSGTGTVTLTVTDNDNATDTASITVSGTTASSSAPTSAGTSACPTALSVQPIPPTISQSFAPATVGPTVASTLTITLTNANGFALTQSQVSVTLPANLTVAATPAAATTCTGADAAVSASGSTVTLSNANIPVKGSCAVTVGVSASATGSYTSTIAAGALSTGPAGANTAASSATLTVSAPKAPGISAAFAPASVDVNAASTLTISLSNPNAYALSAAALANTLPSGLTVMSSPAASTTCGGTLTASGSSIALSGGTLAASGSCALTVTVSSGAKGSYTESIPASALTTTPAATGGAAASATLTVTPSSGGGGALGWLELLGAGALVLGTRLGARRNRASDAIS